MDRGGKAGGKLGRAKRGEMGGGVKVGSKSPCCNLVKREVSNERGGNPGRVLLGTGQKEGREGTDRSELTKGSPQKGGESGSCMFMTGRVRSVANLKDEDLQLQGRHIREI